MNKQEKEKAKKIGAAAGLLLLFGILLGIGSELHPVGYVASGSVLVYFVRAFRAAWKYVVKK